jgi:hypothetical protein
MLILTVCCVGFGHAQQKVPEGLKKLMEDYVKDSTEAYGFTEFQRDLHINFSDIYLGVPIEIYNLNNEKLENLNDTMAVEEFIQPSGKWDMPIYAKKHCVYNVTVGCKANSWIFISAECCARAKSWNMVRAAWPEKLEIQPIEIEYGIFKLLHFPQKDKHNLTFLPFYESDSTLATKDCKVLNDSRKIFAALKKIKHENEEWNRQHPEILGSENGGKDGK